MMSIDIRKGKHCVFNLHVHLVFVTKYRRKVFTKIILHDLKEIFSGVCDAFKATLEGFEGEDDHVHLLVYYPPKTSISKMVNSLKMASSRVIQKKKYPSITKALWENHLWSPSYFAGSCGGASLDVVKQYIEGQKKPK